VCIDLSLFPFLCYICWSKRLKRNQKRVRNYNIYGLINSCLSCVNSQLIASDIMNLIDVPPKAGLQLNHYLAFPYFSIINVYFGLGLWLPFWHVPLLVSLSHKFHRQTESTCDRVYISTKHVCMYVASELCERKQNHWRFESLATFTNLNLDFFAEILNFGFST